MNFGAICSTSGSVLERAMASDFFKSRLKFVLADRQCGAIDVAAKHNVDNLVLDWTNRDDWAIRAADELECRRIDYVFLFYTRIVGGELVARFRDRLINLHPSLLPAYKGLDPLTSALSDGVRIMGTTIHFIDEQLDEGKVIMQTAFPIDPTQPFETHRHRIFVHQCRSLLQVSKWLDDGLIDASTVPVKVEGAQFSDVEYVPNLSFDQAVELEIPPYNP